MRLNTLAGLGLALLGLACAGCEKKPDNVLTIAYAPNESTEQSVDARNGMAAELGKALGMEVKEIHTSDYTAIIEALRTGQADMAYIGSLAVGMAMKRAKATPVVMKAPEGDRAKAIRAILSAFYGEIKNNASNIRFMMMTGVTRFTQLSVFSALNNLNDLTMDSRYATLLGYTEEELEANFSPSLHAHAEVMGLSYQDYRAELRRWYNGYRFAKNSAVRVYNPVAIAKTIGPKEPFFAPTWSKTGCSSSLINYLTMHDIDGRDYENIRGVTETALDICRLEALTPIAMLYQGGYLTIKDFKNPLFTLGIPNEEVRLDLNSLLLQYAAQEEGGETFRDTTCFSLMEADFETFFAQLRVLYAHLPYGSTETRVPEAAYQRILYVLLASWSPFRVTAEDRQAQGRADIVAESDERVFVFELKVDKTAAEALAQIKESGYAEPYRALGKPIHLIGLNFASATHSLSDTVVEALA